MLIEHMLADATFGDAISDRLVHHAHRLTLTGGSLRRLPTPDSTDALTRSPIPCPARRHVIGFARNG